MLQLYRFYRNKWKERGQKTELSSIFMNLPLEIHQNILKQVDHPKTLAVCARLNKTLHIPAIVLLWKGSPTGDALWMTPSLYVLLHIGKSRARLRHYLQFVKYLDLYAISWPQIPDSPLHPHQDHNRITLTNKSTLWDGAKFLSVNIHHDIHLDQIPRQFFGPELHIFVSSLHPHLLGSWAELPANLKYLSLTMEDREDAQELQRFDITRLKCLNLTCYTHIERSVLANFVKTKLDNTTNLEHLTLDEYLITNPCKYFRPESSILFQSLRSLTLDVWFHPSLLRNISNLTNLEYFSIRNGAVGDSTEFNIDFLHDIALPISRNAKLQVFNYECTSGHNIRNCLLGIRSFAQCCPNMQCFVFRCDPEETMSREMTSGLFDLIASTWKNLHTLCLGLTVNMEFANLITLRPCVNLRWLHFDGLESYECIDWISFPQNLFPNLRVFGIDYITETLERTLLDRIPENETNVSHDALQDAFDAMSFLIQRTMPHLEEFQCLLEPIHLNDYSRNASHLCDKFSKKIHDDVIEIIRKTHDENIRAELLSNPYSRTQ